MNMLFHIYIYIYRSYVYQLNCTPEPISPIIPSFFLASIFTRSSSFGSDFTFNKASLPATRELQLRRLDISVQGWAQGCAESGKSLGYPLIQFHINKLE